MCDEPIKKQEKKKWKIHRQKMMEKRRNYHIKILFDLIDLFKNSVVLTRRCKNGNREKTKNQPINRPKYNIWLFCSTSIRNQFIKTYLYWKKKKEYFVLRLIDCLLFLLKEKTVHNRFDPFSRNFFRFFCFIFSTLCASFICDYIELKCFFLNSFKVLNLSN